jgi:hypothetical protein
MEKTKKKYFIEPKLQLIEQKNCLLQDFPESQAKINSGILIWYERSSEGILVEPVVKIFEKKTFVKKWRSAEQNVIEYLNSLPNILSAKDVSARNVGYDAEIIMESGDKICVEIKCVNSFGDAFIMTNNEYALANQAGNQYSLAIVCIDDDNMKICFIKNPVDSLKMQRRIVRWEWVCNEYSGQYYEVPYDEC